MIPLADDIPTHSKPIITIGLIVICCIVFLWQLGLGQSNRAAILALGVIPVSLLQGALLPEALRWVSPELTLITSMFLHGGFMHLIGNMLYLWIFGDNIEDILGKPVFIIFFCVCGHLSLSSVFNSFFQIVHFSSSHLNQLATDFYQCDDFYWFVCSQKALPPVE